MRTDHSALILLKCTPDPTGQQVHWLEIIEEFTSSVEHRVGVHHANADAMSRVLYKARGCVCRDVLDTWQ